MNLGQDQPRRVKDLIYCPDAVILEVIASDEVHILMQRIQRRDQIFPASCPVIRLACPYLQSQLLKEWLHIGMSLPFCLLFYISAAFRQYLTLINIPDTLQIRRKLPIQHFLFIYKDSDIPCRRMYLPKIRVFVKIRPLRISGKILELPDAAVLICHTAEISQLFRTLVSLEDHLFLRNR